MIKNVKIYQESAIFIEKNLQELGFSNKKIIFVSDEIIWKNCKNFFAKDFLQNKTIFLLKNPKADENNLKKISKIAKDYDLILALGSGTINDLCKLTSANLKIPYAIITSAASMNGYLSKNASIKISGHKKTLPACLPVAVFCDLKILQKAPLKLIKAGIGDLMCFYSCWFDWYLSHLILDTKFDKKPFELLKNEMEFLVKNYQKFSLKDEEFLKIIIDILLLSSYGMTIAGGSYPASQSEHLIAHLIEMKYDLKNILHGQQIAVTTMTALDLQKKLLRKNNLENKVEKFPTKEISSFLGKKTAAECEKEFLQKIFTADKVNKINGSLKKNWSKYKKELEKIYFDGKKLEKIFAHFKINYSPKMFGISDVEYKDCVAKARFIRNRFTCLDLYYTKT